MPKVSVIIPSYNHEKYIAQAINSVLAQTLQDFEIVITDDGSDDRTAEIAKSFKDYRIKVFEFPENRGAAVAANHCITQASGEYIAMLSSDDIFLENKLEKQVNFLNSNPDIAAVFTYPSFIDENGNDINGSFYEDVFEKTNQSKEHWFDFFLLNGNCLCHPSALIRRSCYNQVGLYNPSLAQLPDFDLWIRICENYNIYILPEKLIKFRIRDGNQNASAPSTKSQNRSSIEYLYILNSYYGDYLRLNTYPTSSIADYFLQYDIDINQLINTAWQNPDCAKKFITACHCITNGLSGIHKIFGVLMIYELLFESNQEVIPYSKFHELIGSQDFFNLSSLQQTQSQLQQTQSQLQQTQSQLQQTQSQLQQTQSQLQQSQSQLQQTQSQLQQTQSQLQQSRTTIQGMESSKFWLLRNHWVKLKKAIGLP